MLPFKLQAGSSDPCTAVLACHSKALGPHTNLLLTRCAFSCCRQIKRAFRTLRTAAHPDKGGDADGFHRLVTAYNVLSDPDKVRHAAAPHTPILAWRNSPTHADCRTCCCTQRAHYDATGEVHKTASEEFVEAFAGGELSQRVLVWLVECFDC